MQAEQRGFFLIPCWPLGFGRLAHSAVLAAEMDHLIGTLKDAGLCKDVHYKELYIPQAELEGACAQCCLCGNFAVSCVGDLLCPLALYACVVVS